MRGYLDNIIGNLKGIKITDRGFSTKINEEVDSGEANRAAGAGRESLFLGSKQPIDPASKCEWCDVFVVS